MHDGVWTKVHNHPVVYNINPRGAWAVTNIQPSVGVGTQCFYRNRTVWLNWESVPKTHARFTVVKDSVTVAEMIFDAVGTTRNNWYKKEKLINSSWTDLVTSDTPFFGMHGANEGNRRFFIAHHFNADSWECEDDMGWFVMIYDQYPCDHPEGDPNNNFKMLYSKLPTMAHFTSDQVGLADKIEMWIADV